MSNASLSDLTEYVARAANALAARLVEFDEDPEPCSEYIQKLLDAEQALEQQLGVLDDPAPAVQIAELEAQLVMCRACANGMALDALKALMEITGSWNDQNPWLGVTAAVALLKIDAEKVQVP